MPLAGRWTDLVIGVDVHLELVPGSPAPTPFPHPFVAAVFDPAAMLMAELMARVPGAASGGPGPVMIGGTLAMRAADPVRMPVPHIFLPPGVMWGALPPGSDAELMFGSSTVSMGGHRPVRIGEVAMSCSDPVRLPTASVLATPTPRPVMVGGPPLLDTGATPSTAAGPPPSSVPPRTSWGETPSDRGVPLRLGRARDMVPKNACVLTGHPVNVANGCVMTDAVDLELADGVPFERTYSSNWVGRDGPLGPGWSHPFTARLWIEPHAVVVQTSDGREIEFGGAPARVGEQRLHPIEGCTLVRIARDRWELRESDGTTRTFVGPGPARLVAVASTDGPDVALGYDEAGHLVELKVGGASYRLEYGASERDRTRRLIGLWGPAPRGEALQRCVQYLYDDGRLCEVKTGTQAVTRYAYDGDLLVTETGPDGVAFHYRYDGYGRTARCVETWGIDPREPEQPVHHQLLDYDRAGRRTLVTDGLGHTSVYTFDPNLRLIAQSDPMGHTTTFERDAAHRVVRHTDALGQTTQIRYDDAGRPIREPELAPDAEVPAPIPAPADEEARTHGPLGRLRTRTRGGERIAYRYDAEGRLVGIDDAAGRTATLQRDARGDVVAQTDFEGRATQFDRDPLRRIVQITRPSGARIRYAYDPAGRVVDVAHEDATPLRYAYRDDGALSEASLDDRATRFDCDPRGRIVAEHGEDGTVEIQRDRAGRVIVVRGPHGVRVEYIRDAAGRIAKVVACTETARWEATRSYDAAGGLIDTQLPGGIRSYWWRDAAGRPTQHYVGTDDRSLRLRRYTWSASGRLQQLDEEGMPPEIVRYDVWGRSLADAPTVEHVFDEDGRVIECPVEAGTLTLQWDDADQLRSVTGSDGRVSSATYDAFGRRLARDDDGRVTRWLWVGDLPLLQWEPDASAPILWVFDPDTFEPLARLCGPQTWSIVADQRRAPLCLLDARGELAWSSQGDRLGRGPITGDASLCPWRLCGQLEDPTGLRDNRWRSFDPRAGRYLAPDPLGLRAGLDVYAYVDDPRTQVDPRGLLPCGAGPAGGGDPTADLDLDPRPRSFAADRRGRAPAFRG